MKVLALLLLILASCNSRQSVVDEGYDPGAEVRAPTMAAIGTQTTTEDTPLAGIAVVIADPDSVLTCAGSLSAQSSDTAVVADAGLVITGSAPNCQLAITPVMGAAGSATITLTVTDGVLSSQRSFTFIVTAVNGAPTISNVADQTTNEDTTLAAVSVVIADGDSTLNCATALTGTSSNTGVIADAGITFAGTVPNCTVSFAPVANANGAATITLTVSDGTLTAQDTLTLTVAAVNDAPTISDVVDQTTNEDTTLTGVAVVIADGDTALSCASALSGTSSDTSVIANAGITFGGTAPNCTASFAPVANANGAATITLTLTDGALTAQDTLTLTVAGVNDAPTISDVANQTTSEDTTLTGVAVVIADAESALSCASALSASSSDTGVIADAGITFAGTAPNCTVNFAPVTNASGVATITLTASDGTLTAQDTLTLTVAAIDDVPTISDVANQTTNEDTTLTGVAVVIADAESALSCASALSATSSNTSVIADAAITFAGTAPNCTASFAPVADANGTATITLTVTDGALTAQDTLSLTVTAINDAPTISNVADQTTNEDTTLTGVAVVIADTETALSCASALSATSSNTGLIADAAITFTGTAPNCTASFAPVADANGTATITLSVSDGTLTAQDTLTLTVNAVNDAPTISAVANQTLAEDVPSAAIAFNISDVDNTLDCTTSMAKSSSVTSVIATAGIALAGSAPSCTVTLTPVTNSSGTTTVTLTVSDGTLTASTNFNVTVTAAPDVLSVTEPANNTYGLGSSLTFEVAYDTNALVLGVPRLVLNIGGFTRYATYTTGTGSSTLIFTYVVTAGETDADGITANPIMDLNGGSILSGTGDAFPLDLSAQLSSLTNVLVNTSLAPPGQVTAVIQTNLSVDSSQATFTWTAPAPGGAPITEYLVQYREVGTVPFTTLSPNPTTATATISGLNVNTTYQVRVAAYNGVVGPSSALLSFTTFFNPKSLGALIWYEAKDINGTGVAPTDGTSITTLVDKSGRNNNAALKGGETAGVIQTNGGRKVLRVTNANYQTLNSLGEAGNSHLEVYLIAKVNTVTASFAFCNENCLNATTRFGTHFPWSDNNAYIDLPFANRLFTNWGGNTTNFFAWTFRSSTTSGRALERNGVSIINGSNRANSTSPLKKWNLFGNQGTTENWQADFVAIFIFEKVLTPGQRQLFFDYIETNYAVVMP